MDFIGLVEQIDFSHQVLRKKALESVNQLLVMRNWLIGFHIVNFEQMGADRAAYGEKLIPRLAQELRNRRIKGMSETNLRLFRTLYQTYPQIGQSVADFLEASAISIGQPVADLLEQSSKAIQQPLAVELIRANTSADLVVSSKKLITHFSFRHFTELIKITDPLKRAFYEKEAISGNWSARELKRQIDSLFLERLGISKDKDQLLALLKGKTEENSLAHTIKDPYVFEFLGFPELPVYTESDLETAILDKIQEFLLEMGTGFCFEARQKRITVGNEHDRVDLVFYHRILKCHVLIDLKTRDFSHADVGQMNFYLNYFRENMMQSGDNPPVGIILCTQKDTEKVKYATAGLDHKLFVSNYLVQLPSEEELLKLIKERF